MRWLYHLVPVRDDVGDPYAPPSLESERFIHCSYRPAVAESARLYFEPGVELRVLRIDPRKLQAEVRVAETPRGPMPHVHGAIPRAAIVETLVLDALAAAPDEL
jgi:uncharacterized protein (DUF952 family)